MTGRSWRGRTVPCALTGVLLAVTVGACGVPRDAGPRALDASAAPFRSAFTPASPVPTGAARALVYLVRDGVLVGVTRRVAMPATPELVVQSLVAGPTPREREAGLVTAVTEAATVAGADQGVLRVEIAAPDEDTGARNDEVIAYAQLVVTLTSLPGVAAVEFVRDGQPLRVPQADGSLTDRPLTRRDYATLL